MRLSTTERHACWGDDPMLDGSGNYWPQLAGIPAKDVRMPRPFLYLEAGRTSHPGIPGIASVVGVSILLLRCIYHVDQK